MKRHKLLNIHYLGGNGGEFLASYLQRHKEFNQHNTDQRDDLVKYSYKRDDYDHLSQIYLGLGTHRCLAQYSPRKFFQELWQTSNDKWTLRIDHGYGYTVQMDQWIKGLYEDWNLSKTIILNTTELEEAPLIQNQIGAVQSMAGRLETMLTKESPKRRIQLMQQIGRVVGIKVKMLPNGKIELR